MNITEANLVNTLLGWLVEMPDPCGRLVSHTEGRDAAELLAERANKALSAGITAAEVRAAWHWVDDGPDGVEGTR